MSQSHRRKKRGVSAAVFSVGDGSFCWFEDMLQNQFETLREKKTTKKNV